MRLNQFLQHIFLDNTILQWITTAGIIALAFIIKRYLSEYVAKIILKLFKKYEYNVYRMPFLKNIVQPLENLIFWLVTFVTLDKLKYPQVLAFNMYKKLSFHELLIGISSAWIIICIFRLLIGVAYFISYVIMQRSVEQKNRSATQAVSLLADLVRVVLIVIALFIILKFSFNYDISSLITGLGLVTAALALAAKESVENLICSFIIFFDKPFMVGDFVKVNKDVSGNIEKIGLRSTRIRTPNKTLITMANKMVIGGVLENVSDQTRRRFTQVLEMSIRTSEQKMRAFIDAIRSIIASHEDVINDESLSVYFTEAGVNANKISIEYFTWMNISFPAFRKLNEDINLEILQKAAEMDVHFANPNKPTVVLHPEPPRTACDDQLL